MAYLKGNKSSNGKTYYRSRIKNVHWSKGYIYVSLNTTNYNTALERHQEVEDKEKGIKNGMKFSWSWEKESNKGKARILKQNIQEISEKWLDMKKTNVRAETHKRYKFSIQSFLNVIGHTSPLSILDNKCIEGYKAACKLYNTNGGINVNLRGIKCFLLWALEEGYIKSMPKIKMMPTEKNKPKYINDISWDRIMSIEINHTKLDFYKRVFTLYRDTGMRRSEAILGRLEGNFLIVDAKHSKTGIEKEISLDSNQIGIVNELHNEKDTFLNNGNSIDTFKNNFTKLFKKICNKLEIDASLHSLRHTFAVRRYLQTKDLYRVCKELGHTSILTTEIYARFSFVRLEQDFPTLSKVPKIRVLDTQKGATHNSQNKVSSLWN